MKDRRFPQLHSPKGHFYIEMVTGETTKRNALLRLYQMLGLQKQEVACVGDGENDIPMFRQAGLKFAVGNAAEQLKTLADHVVATNDEDGVAEAIENILKKRNRHEGHT